MYIMTSEKQHYAQNSWVTAMAWKNIVLVYIMPLNDIRDVRKDKAQVHLFWKLWKIDTKSKAVAPYRINQLVSSTHLLVPS